MIGLYDTDGILRFTGVDREACLAYAELFDLPVASCSLMALHGQEVQVITRQNRRRLEVSSN